MDRFRPRVHGAKGREEVWEPQPSETVIAGMPMVIHSSVF